MVKCNYFENLEELSKISASAVRIACTTDTKSDISELRIEGDRLVLLTEDALFSDFLPPLERDNIAAAAHSLSRIIDVSSELISDISVKNGAMICNEEADICVRLADKLSSCISLLRRIRKPNETPDIQGFRELLSQGRKAHRKMIQKVRSGAIPRSSAEAIILTGRLRSELSRAFDELVEIMLNNI